MDQKFNIENSNSPKELYNVFNFLKEIDWTEPWLIGLIAFHALITVLAIATRDHGNFQAVFFLLLLFLVFCSEALNELAARHWKYFAYQQYFDSNGMFISLVYCAPLLINCIVMVGQWLWTSCDLMIRLKQAKLKKQRRSEECSKKK